MSLAGNNASKFFWISHPGGRSDQSPASTPRFSDISRKIGSLGEDRDLIFSKNAKDDELMIMDWSMTSWWDVLG